jgi:hypothetical protein
VQDRAAHTIAHLHVGRIDDRRLAVGTTTACGRPGAKAGDSPSTHPVLAFPPTPLQALAACRKGRLVDCRLIFSQSSSGRLRTICLFTLHLVAIVSILALAREDAKAQFAQKCLPDQYFDRGNGPDPNITEFAIALSDATCPLKETSNDSEYQLPVGAPLHFWLRLQGSLQYAGSARIGAPVDLRIERAFEGGSLSYEGIRMGEINRGLALAESRLTGGRFDWRFAAYKSTFTRPGSYTARVWQGGRRVCITDPMAVDCTVRFRVR